MSCVLRILACGAAVVPFFCTGELIHRWSMNETSGTTLSDSVGGSGGTIVVQGGAGHTLGGGRVTLAGGAKGTSDYVNLGSGLISGLTDVTIELWATRHAVSNWARVFSFGAASSTADALYLTFARNSNGNQQRLDFQPLTNIDTSLNTADGTRYHFAVVWKSNGGAEFQTGRLEWYRNGVLAKGIEVGATTAMSVADALFMLGRSEGNHDTANASYDEVRIYDEALSAAAIAANTALGPDNAMGTAPAAVNDVVELNPGGAARIPVLANDTGDLVSKGTVEIVTPPGAGTAAADANGQVLYTHTGGIAGGDSFTYRVGNIFGTMSAPATVNVTITTADRFENTTLQLPGAAPTLAIGGVNAFPGMTWVDPICLRTPPGDTKRLFVCEKRGRIYVIPDVTAAVPLKILFLDLQSLVGGRAPAEYWYNGGEGGLLSIAFHPDYETNRQFYVYYTPRFDASNGPIHDRLSCFQAQAGNSNAADTSSEVILFQQNDQASNHNGGGMHFGSDGYLYLALGDEGGANDTYNNSQKIDADFFSAMLRIDVDKKAGNLLPNDHPAVVTHNGALVSAGGTPNYLVPADNPFVGATAFNGSPVNTAAVRTEFWAVGLRNPWQWWFHPTMVPDQLILADVGQGSREEINIVTKGGNYGWDFFEGTIDRGGAPAGFAGTPPVYEYLHGSGTLRGNSVTGGVVYIEETIPELKDRYIFADYVSGNVWSMDPANPSGTVQRIFGDTGIICFGYDPGNGDVLYGDNDDLVKRIVKTTVSNFPETLSDTGGFRDLAALVPNPGVLGYEPNVTFWSDLALKKRWFTVPSVPDKITFSEEGNWTFPEGAVWVKHFDLEMTRGVPASAKRIETRYLVKTAEDVYGVSYRWNETGTEAYLVGDGGVDITYQVDAGGGSMVDQTWRIPSRAECLSCHTQAGGRALSFNTRQLNRNGIAGGIGGAATNQIQALSDAGYFAGAVSGVDTMPAFAVADDTTKSLEYRVRSYLAVNCVSCHQAGGSGPPTWSALAALTLEDTGLVDGAANNMGVDSANRLAVPGSELNSILLHRLDPDGLHHAIGTGENFGRMPNLGSNLLDESAIQLVKDWINSDLPGRQFYADFQSFYWPGLGAESGRTADVNGDGEDNYFEFLTGQNPLAADERWEPAMSFTGPGGGTMIRFDFERFANLGMQVLVSTDLVNWSLWDVPGNRPAFEASGGADTIEGAFDPVSFPELFFRWRLTEP